MNKQIIVLGVLLFAAAAMAFVDKTNFYPLPLANKADCEKFAGQNTFVLAKCKAWLFESTLFMDQNHTIPLKDCLMVMRKMRRNTPTVFYALQGVKKITEQMVDLMAVLASEVDSFAKIIPQVLFFEGPGGDPKQLMNGTHRINTPVALAAVEKESMQASYSWEFFMSLMNAKKIIKTDEKFLVLNGWHLVSIKEKPVIPLEFPTVFMGVVVYVEPAKARMISKSQVMAYAGDFARPFYLDMAGSPNGAGGIAIDRLLFGIFLVVAVGSSK